MYYKFCIIFITFIIYSFLGYIIEVLDILRREKRLVISRGFFIGPYLPIYGFGSLLMLLFLTRYQDELITLFIMSSFVCTLLEYLTSLILEKIFKLRWWDYYDRKHNLDGRVCLENAILFGFGGIVVVDIVNPLIIKLLLLFSKHFIIIIATILLILFLTDLVVSIFILIHLEINVSKYFNTDATSKIKKEVKASLSKYSTLTYRLFRSFPDIQAQDTKAFQTFKKLIFKAMNEVKKITPKSKKKNP